MPYVVSLHRLPCAYVGLRLCYVYRVCVANVLVGFVNFRVASVCCATFGHNCNLSLCFVEFRVAALLVGLVLLCLAYFAFAAVAIFRVVLLRLIYVVWCGFVLFCFGLLLFFCFVVFRCVARRKHLCALFRFLHRGFALLRVFVHSWEAFGASNLLDLPTHG